MGKRSMRVIPVAGLLLALWSNVALAGTDQLVGDLRVDLPSVNQARDYTAWVWNEYRAPGASGYTTGWFSVNLAQYDGQTYSAQFTQVGILNDSTGVHWFFYSEAGSFGGVSCLRGSSSFGGFGCLSAAGDMGVGSLLWTKVELVAYPGQGFWIARVYDQNGGPVDVAHANYSSLQIYRAEQNGEEAYNSQSDPQYFMNYYHWHPQYNTWSTGFADWPASSGGNNNVFSNASIPPVNFCPSVYGGFLNYFGDPRYWGTYSGGPTCGPVNPWF